MVCASSSLADSFLGERSRAAREAKPSSKTTFRARSNVLSHLQDRGIESCWKLVSHRATGKRDRRRTETEVENHLQRGNDFSQRCADGAARLLTKMHGCLARFEWNGKPTRRFTFIGFASVHRVRVFPLVRTRTCSNYIICL